MSSAEEASTHLFSKVRGMEQLGKTTTRKLARANKQQKFYFIFCEEENYYNSFKM
jgi:predicted AAA+ superfamily ATPase